MRNGLLIVTLVVILLGVAVGTPLYVLGKQKTELKDTISALEATITERVNTISELNVTNAGLLVEKELLQQTITQLGVTIAEVQSNISSLESQLLEQYNANVILQGQQTELQVEKELLQQAITQVEVAISELQSNISSLESQLLEQYNASLILQALQSQLEGIILELQATNVGLASQNEYLQSYITELTDYYDEVIEQLQAIIAALQ